jgi:hypothetical protein
MPHPRHVTLLAAAGLLCAACSSSGGPSARSTTPTPAPVRSGAPATGPRGPAAFGTVAAMTGTTMQVQNPQTGQTAVTWTSATVFTHQVSVPLSAIKAGDCVTAVGSSGTSLDAASFAATSVLVEPARNGSCTGGFVTRGGRSGSPPSGGPASRPSGAPSRFPGGGRAPAGAIASGKVTAVSGATLTVAAQRLGATGTVTRTVTVSGATKISTQARTTAKSLAVGRCVSAQGKADSTGTVAATRVQISDATDGQCGPGIARLGVDGG